MAGLHELHPAGPRGRRKRVGRGIGSGHGKTSTRGQKGQKARSGGAKGAGFEGGQMPLQRRLPHRGFNNSRFRKVYAIVNVGALEQFVDGSVITPDLLQEKRVVRQLHDGVKILGEGDLTHSLTVRAHAFSQSAKTKIEAAGGRAEVI